MGIEFIFPLRQLHWWLGLALVVMTLIVFGLRILETRRRTRLHNFVDAGLAPRLLLGYDPSMRRPLFWLTAAGFAFLALTFAQPHWGQAWQEIRQQSHDIIVCMDTSLSMNAVNPAPSRIERAKQKALSILDRTPGDRFALVAFSGAAVLECPLTHDLGYFKSVLNAIDTDTISVEGTDIAAAIREAEKVFREESEKSGIIDNNSRAIILVSDGEQVSGDAVAEAEKAADFARVYVIGVGDPEGTEVRLPDWMMQYVKNKAPHISKLDEDTLTKVAVAGKGGYVRSTPDNSDIGQIYDYVRKLTAYAASSDIRFRLVNRYQWPLALAIICFAGEGVWIALMPWLRSWRMRRTRGNEASAWARVECSHG